MSTAFPEFRPASPSPQNVLRWGSFFMLAYAIQGFSQTATLFTQPINYYYKTAHQADAGELARIAFLLGIPWYLKPIYGLLSDFVPFLGTRRKSYLLLLSLLSTLAFGLLIGVDSPVMLFWLLMMTTVGTAMSDVMVDGLMIEKGQATGRIKLFQGLQWTAIYATTICASLAAAAVSKWAQDASEPIRGIQWAAMMAVAGPAIMFVLTWLMVDEPRSRLDIQGFKQTLAGVKEAGQSRPLLLAAIFICVFWFQPGMDAPMNKYCTGEYGLGLSEWVYGKAGFIAGFGYIAGAIVFLLGLAPFFSIRKLAAIAIVLYTAATLGYLFLVGPRTLAALGFFMTFSNAIATLMLLSLAAQVCPKRVEAFVFAFLMAMLNFSRRGSEWIGGELYAGILDKNINPLIILSAGVTLLTLALVPLLPTGHRDELG